VKKGATHAGAASPKTAISALSESIGKSQVVQGECALGQNAQPTGNVKQSHFGRARHARARDGGAISFDHNVRGNRWQTIGSVPEVVDRTQRVAAASGQDDRIWTRIDGLVVRGVNRADKGTDISDRITAASGKRRPEGRARQGQQHQFGKNRPPQAKVLPLYVPWYGHLAPG
jgi:hypothetical protein